MKSYIKLATIVALYLVFVSAVFSQNAKPPYPIVFVHGWAGNEEAWTHEDGNWQEFLTSSDIGWTFGGVINICLDNFQGGLNDPASIDVNVKYAEGYENNADFYFLNFDINKFYQKDPDYDYRFYPFNYSSTSISFISNGSDFSSIHINDILVAYDQSSKTKDLYTMEYMVVTEVDPILKKVAVNRGSFYPDLQRDWSNYSDVMVKNFSNLSNQASIVKGGIGIKMAVEGILNDRTDGRDSVILVAHSMGGLNCRYFIQQNPEDNNVAKLVTIGTPHLGSNTSDVDFIGLNELLDLDMQSDAVRDLRVTIDEGEHGPPNHDNDNGIFLFGGMENTEWPSFSWYNKDFDGNGFSGSNTQIQGLNSYNTWPAGKLFHCIIGIDPMLMQYPPNQSDFIVRADRQYPHDYIFPENVSDFPGNLDTSRVYIPCSFGCIAHLNESEQISAIMRGLDEPDFMQYAYEVHANAGFFNGFTSYQRFMTNNDQDWYKFKASTSGQAIFEIYNLSSSNWNVGIIGEDLQPLGGINNSSGLNSVQFDVIENQYYYIFIENQCTSDSWEYPYKFRITTSSLPLISIITTNLNMDIYGPNDPATITVNLGNNLTGANVTFTCNSQTYSCLDAGGGVYTTTFNVPSSVGTYPIIVYADKAGYTSAEPFSAFLNVEDIGNSPYPPYINITLPNNDICHDECFITWDAVDPDNNAVIYLYYDNNNYGLNGTCINPGNPLFENYANGYTWNTTSMPEGYYYIYATIDDGTTMTTDYSPGTIQIDHPNLSTDFSYSSKRTTEDNGDGDGIVEEGESFDLEIWIRNLDYDEYYNNVDATLTTTNTHVNITDNSSGYADFAPRQTLKNLDDFDIQIDAGWHGTVEFELNLAFMDSEGYLYYQIIDLPGVNISQNVSPSFQVVELQFIDVDNSCNNDGLLQSGEGDIEYNIKIMNNGVGAAHEVEGYVQPFLFNSSISDASFPDISVGSSAWNVTDEDFDLEQIPLNFVGVITANLNITWGNEAFSQTIPVTFEVFPAPRIGYNPLTFDFGIIPPGDTITIPLTVWNNGSADLVISQIENLSANSGNWISDAVYPVTVLPSDTVIFNVKVTRANSGNVSDTLRIHSNNHVSALNDFIFSGTFFEQVSSGTFNQVFTTDPALNQSGEWVEVDDVDNDGKKDAVSFYNANLFIWEQAAVGSTNFELKYTYTVLPGGDVVDIESVRVGNCDGDNNRDIVIIDYNYVTYTQTLRVFETNGNDSYAQVFSTTIQGADYAEVGNCDSDANDEIIFYYEYGATVYVYNNSGNNNYTTTWNSGPITSYGVNKNYMGFLTTGDTDNNGRREIVLPGDDEYIFIWEKNTSGAGYTLKHDPLITYTPDPDGTDMYPKVFDLDYDGNNEIVIGGDKEGFEFFVFNPNTWTFEFTNSTGLYSEFCYPAFSDIDANGITEVYFGETLSPFRIVSYEYSNGSYFETYKSESLLDNIGNIETSDLDNDGIQELIVSVDDHFKVFQYEAPQQLPDLQIVSNNVILSNPTPQENEQIQLSALIRNIGTLNTQNIAVEFYKNEILSGNRIDSLNISALAVMSDTTITLQWSSDLAGTYQLYVVIDRLNHIPELDSTNNMAFKNVIVTDDDVIPPVFLSHICTEYLGDGDGLIEDNESIKFDWQVSDESGISSSYLIFNNGQPLNAIVTGGGSYFLTLSDQESGLYPYEIHAADNDNSPMTSVIYDTIIIYQHAPNVISNYPLANSVNVAVSDSIVVEFDILMNSSSINTTTFLVFKDGNIPVIPFSLTYFPSSNRAIFEPGIFESGVSYMIKLISGPNGIKDINNNHLESDFIWSFTTREEQLNADFIASNTIVMGGSTIAFTDLSEGNPTSWQWTFEGGTPAISYDQFPIVSYNTPGVWDVSLTAGNGNNSSTLIKSDYITVTNPPASVSVSPSELSFGNILVGSSSVSQSYTVTGSNLTASITVSAPTGFAVSAASTGPWTNSVTLPQTGGNVNTTVYANFSPTSATTYSGNITNASTGATAQNVAVTGTGIFPCPVSVTIVPSANPVCSGTSVTFTATPTNGGTSPTYQWKRNGTNAGTNSPTYVLTPNNNDVITCVLTSNLSCATGNPATSNPITMTVNPVLPVSVSITTSANPVCSGTSVTLTATPSNGGTSPTYQWKRNGTNAGTNSPTYVLTPNNNDVITCHLTSNLSCTTGNPASSNSITIVDNPVPPQPGDISGNSSVCQGTPQTYSIQPVSGATSYTWSLPQGWTGSSTTTSITTTVGSNSGTISVLANNACGPGPVRTLNVGVATVPAQPGEISGNATTSQGITETYSIEPVPGATSYNWTLPAGWSGSSTTTSITTTVGASGGSVTVAAVNACGTGPTSTKNVNVTATPLILVSPETLAFGNVNIGSSSAPQSYNVQGSNLTSNVLVSASAGFSLSLSLSGQWNTALSLVPNLGIVNTTVFVQFNPTAQVPYSGIITNASTGATTRDVTVTGTGTDIPGLNVEPLSRSVASSAGSTTFSVTSNTTWAAVSSQPWCVVTSSGTGNGTITATYDANTTNASRTALITVTAPGLPEVVVSLVQAGSEFEISAVNLIQTAPNVLEFDVYLLDLDASEPFELASVQLGFLLNSGICSGGTLTAQYDNSGSGLLPAQQFTASASVVSALAGYPNQTLIRLVGKTPPGTGNGTIISATSPGTLLTHFILTSSVPFTGNSTPDMTFTSNTVTVPLYATKVAAYIGGVNTQLLVTPGANALIVGNPVLNGPPEISISPLTQNAGVEAGSAGFVVQSNASWTAQSNQSWCSVTPSGFGNGTLTATYSANAGVARSGQITVTVAGLSPVVLTLNQQGYETKVLNLYALLEGLYNGNGTMDQAGDEYGAHFPQGVADHINVELHDAADYGIIRLLITDVELGTNGIAIIDVPQEFSGSYYITIKHRNSIETTSALPVSFSEPLIDYAFDLPSKAHGNNMQLMVDGYYVIYGGDVNVDDAVDTGDMTLVDNESTNYTAGYVSEDVNGDGQVDTGDMIVVDNNAAQYIGAVFPASTSVLMVTTLPVNGITRTSATSGGNVVAQGPLQVIARGVCWSTSPEPQVTDEHTIDGSGSGQFISNLTNLTPGTRYYIRAYATNSSGTEYGLESNFFTVLYTNGNGLTDIHGNHYPSIILGTQEWSAENLRVTKYSNGDDIPNVTNSSWSGLTSGAYRWYNDDEASYKNNYGGLYNWYAVTDSRKLCPSGWRSPNTADWATLSESLGGIELAGGKMKSTRTSPLAHPRWDQPNTGATDISGFGGYPGGYCLHTGSFGELGLSSYWWNASPEPNNSTTMRALINTDDNLYADNSFRQAAFSARCIKEITTAVITTGSVSNITGVTAVCGGNISSDGGSQITQRGVCWSNEPEPTIEDFFTVNGSGTGSFESILEGLAINTIYYVRAYAINGAGVSYGSGQAITFKTLFYVEGNGVADNSGNNYSSVFLGTQEWMAENLRTANYRNGDAIPNVTNATDWIGLSTGAWCFYSNNSQLENPYGKYYNWYAVTDARQLCPAGWQIPTDADWTVLTDFLGGIYTADERLKEADFAHWNPSGYNGDNSSGFTGLPGGRRYFTDGSYLYMMNLGYHWSSTQATPTTAWCRVLGYQYSGVSRSEYNFKNGMTVRCMRQVSAPSVVTNPINGITGISASGGGTITSDGGSPVFQRGLCWSTSSNPTIDSYHTSEGPGSGDFTSAISGLSPNTVYYVRAYATNSAGTSYGNNISFTSALFVPGLGVTDIDNNSYPTIILGTQEWMAENLKVTHYRNGDQIPNVTEVSQWVGLSTGAYCWYSNDIGWKDAYGALYNWYTVADNRNVCPSGWHIPTDAEWTSLTDFLGSEALAGGKIKSIRTDPDVHPRWDTPNIGATGESGFKGFPGGVRFNHGLFWGIGADGHFWTSSEESTPHAWYRNLVYQNSIVYRGFYPKGSGYSIRCLKD